MKHITLFLLLIMTSLIVAQNANAQKQLYTATIQNTGSVVIDFDTGEANRYSTSFLDHPARITKSAEVVGLKGRVVQLLKANIGADWNPVLVMRTADGKVFLLNIRETIDTGDYTCGLAYGVRGAIGLKAMKQKGQFWTTPAAVLKGGKTDFIVGSGAEAGYYVIASYDLVIHITSDYGINITDKEGEPIVSGTWYQSWAGSGMMVMSCAFDKGETEVDMYLDENSEGGEVRPSFKIHPIAGQPANLLPFDKKLDSILKYMEPY